MATVSEMHVTPWLNSLDTTCGLNAQMKMMTSLSSSLSEYFEYPHTCEKPHRCCLLKIIFRVSNLNRHMRLQTNTNEKPHQCNVCSKSWLMLNGLLIVMRNVLTCRLHTNSRRVAFTCKLPRPQFKKKILYHNGIKHLFFKSSYMYTLTT